MTSTLKRLIMATKFISGISGIYAAKLYLDLHPVCRLAILDKDHYVGGTWNSSKRRLRPVSSSAMRDSHL